MTTAKRNDSLRSKPETSIEPHQTYHLITG